MRILVTGSSGHWTMAPTLDRVDVNDRARTDPGWEPHWDFASTIERVRTSPEIRSPLAIAVGSRGYHDETFADGPYPVEG